ncbi:Proton-dependent oligopeptide transporter [Trema orientale]|uniref:Proton-dependent oligopeptide transporter n=1 Tax=Trema orientale TaxID=63057 RepID=A0A2P5FQL8_TREOI|nr:Proton-dependent oligopeptide transporter [Trema orientale]
MKQPSCSTFSSLCIQRCFKNNSLISFDDHDHQDLEPAAEKTNENMVADNSAKRKSGGWRAVSFILANETCERLASFGLLGNFMVYLMTKLNMDQVSASNVLNIWNGVTNFAPLVGAFISDAYAGRFRTIAYASFASLLGMGTLTLTAWLPQLHPHACTKQEVDLGHCRGPNQTQLGFLILGLGLVSIGSGGIRPCSIPFGVDQFDPATHQGRKGINSFFNWYYTTLMIVLLLSQTIVVYVQDKVSWVIGFGIPAVLMACSIIFFFFGTKLYYYVKPEGSIFSSIAQVFVAAYKKRHLKLPAAAASEGGDDDHVVGGVQQAFYDPPMKGRNGLSKLPRTNQYRFLDKAAVIMENELNQDGTPVKKWRLCSIQQVEELKCLVRIAPIWATGVISLTAMVQQVTFTVSQALVMDRHLGANFEIPAGSISVISFLTISIWLPFYDRILVPALRRTTNHEDGITLLQRIGIGNVFSILSMVVAGSIENKRRASPNPISVLWLGPHLILLGFCEAFNILGQIEFFNRQFPEHMRSMGNALFSCSFGGASYLSSLLVTVVHRVTATRDRPDWLTNDLNKGRLDYFYYLLAGLCALNLVCFLYCANGYRYKGAVVVEMDEDKVSYVDVEMSSSVAKA